MSLEQVLSHVDSRCDTYVEQLREFVRIPSISAGADGDAAADIGRAVDFLIADFQRLELQAEKIQVTPDTNPLVLARPSTLSPERPTVLIYGHYDVQGVETLIGEPGYSLLEQRWIRPTLEINHLSGGSPRTVIPATATAAISCRLVPDQDPARIEAAL